MIDERISWMSDSTLTFVGREETVTPGVVGGRRRGLGRVRRTDGRRASVDDVAETNRNGEVRKTGAVVPTDETHTNGDGAYPVPFVRYRR